MKKRLLVVISCISLSVGGSLITAASPHTTESGGVLHRTQECGNCGDVSLNTSVNYGSWKDIRSVQCKKYGNKRDMVQEREQYTTYKCGNCGYNKTVVSTQERVWCTH